MANNPNVPKTEIHVGLWSGHGLIEEGAFHFEQQPDKTYKYWRWDGRRWRPRVRVPGAIVQLTERMR